MISVIALILVTILYSPFVGVKLIVDGQMKKDQGKVAIGCILLIAGIILCSWAFN